MKVAVLGAGAMGTILGAYLTKGGCDTVLIDNYQAHVDALNEKGASVIGYEEFTVPVKAITPEQMEGTYDIVFLFTKQTANDQILPVLLPHLNGDSVVCTLQNGVPEPYVAKHVGAERTVGGAVVYSATFMGPGQSKLTQDIRTQTHLFVIGEMDGKITDRIQKVAQVLELMGPVHITSTLMSSRWQKLIYNACVSGMSAALNTTFGGVVSDNKSRACATYIGNELLRCCAAEGYTMEPLIKDYSPELLAIRDEEEYKKAQLLFWDIYQISMDSKASMLQDLEHGRKTEVSMINGYVCEVGRKHGIPTPFNDTVVEIVTKIENHELELSWDNIRFFKDEWFRYPFFDPSQG